VIGLVAPNEYPFTELFERHAVPGKFIVLPLYVTEPTALLWLLLDPDLSIHVLTFEPELNVTVVGSFASNHSEQPDIEVGKEYVRGLMCATDIPASRIET